MVPHHGSEGHAVTRVLRPQFSRLQGEHGEQGEQGLQGVQGLQGEQGIQGIPGTKGDKGDQGVQGPQGDPGSQGPAGPSGLSGYEIVTDGGDFGLAVAICPIGKVVVGGGFNFSLQAADYPLPEITNIQSSPSDSGNAWVVLASNPGTPVVRTIAYAICVTGP